ncbi:MAG: hypothetical protein GX624_11570 [Actinobacteria bacterium]|nr:hypothetical protein [Actinomycetota bacterium]
MMERKKWGELSGRTRTLLVVLGVVEVALAAAALFDLRRRPAALVKGPKWVWSAVSFVDIVGPLSYFAFGRRRAAVD